MDQLATERCRHCADTTLSEQMEPLLERLNRFPDKTFVEFLNLAGVQPLQASPAAALLEFEVSENAPQSISSARDSGRARR